MLGIIVLIIYMMIQNEIIIKAKYKKYDSKKYALMSTSLVDRSLFFYIAYLPAVCLAWRRLNYEPFIIFVKNQTVPVNAIGAKTIQYLKFLKVNFMFLDAQLGYENHIGMLTRLFAGLIPSTYIHDEDFILLTDTDMVPIQSNYFSDFLANTSEIILRNENYIGEVQHNNETLPMLSMCYIGMKKQLWKAVMKLKGSDILSSELIFNKINEFQGGELSVSANANMSRGDKYWYMDQKSLTVAVHNYMSSEAGKWVKFNSKERSGMRLDRADSEDTWYWKLNSFDGCIDSHLFHQDGFSRLKNMMDLFTKLFERRTMGILTAYFSEFKKKMDQ